MNWYLITTIVVLSLVVLLGFYSSFLIIKNNMDDKNLFHNPHLKLRKTIRKIKNYRINKTIIKYLSFAKNKKVEV